MPVTTVAQGKTGDQKKAPPIKFKADIEKGVVITTFERNGWVRTEGEDWTIGWFNVGNIRAMFHPDSAVRLGDHQMVNHYPNHWELTRKVLFSLLAQKNKNKH
jgi:tubulin polyglutamylase TTLL1